MDPLVVGVLGIIVLIVLLSFGLHVAIAMGLVGIAGMTLLIGFDAAVHTSVTLSLAKVSNYTMIIVPLYILMGTLALQSGLSKSAYEALRLWFGKLPGGLGIATVGACTMFGTVCGSSLVTAAVFANLSAPEMRRFGYDKKFAYGICSCSGLIGMLIPPSVLIVIYGLLTEDPIGRLLIAGISPGVMLFILFSLSIAGLAYFKPNFVGGSIDQSVSWREKFASIKLIWRVLVIIGIVFGGIFSGIFSPSEAGAVSCMVLLVSFLISKSRSWKGLKTAIYEGIAPVGMIFLILIGAGIFTRFLSLSTLAPKVLIGIINLNLPDWGFLAGTVIIYLVLGCFFDSISMLSLTLPFLHPAAMEMGIDPLHFAMVAIIAIEMGMVTPPMGLNIYAVKGVAESDVSLADLFLGIFPFFIMMCVCVILFIALPALSTWLPMMMAE